MTTFIHTADWQLGKPFAGVEDAHKRSLLQQERLTAIGRIGDAVREHGAQFVVVAGDLFDSPRVTKAIVSAACAKIGALKVPVYVIPGNHDHGGPGSIWDQAFFRQERDQLAPNLQVIVKPEPLDVGGAVIFSCPLLRRHEPTDLTAWLREADHWDAQFPGKPRIVLAHGSVQGFGSQADDEDAAGGIANFVDIARLADGAYDYIALGDWHGTKQVSPCAWFAGTHEIDRFPKGGDHDPGNILIVSVDRASPPAVKPVRTSLMRWHVVDFPFADDTGVAQLATRLSELLEARIDRDLLRLSLTGSLGLEATDRLDALLEQYQARLIRLKLTNATFVAPSHDEVVALTQRSSDPLIARVATTLVARAAATGEDAEVARIALRELHAACVTR